MRGGFGATLGVMSWVFVVACGSNSPRVQPDIDEFDIPPQVQTDIDAAAEQGEGAEGSFSYDDSTEVLTITLTASTFDCGIETGVIRAQVVALTATTMQWSFLDEQGSVTWTRVDTHSGVSVVGVWKTDAPALYLILSEGGDAQIFGEQESCADDRPRNEFNCVELQTSGIDVTVDGDLSEWASASAGATITDVAGDHLGSDPGADLRAIKVEYGASSVFVVMELAGPPSTSFQGGAPPNSGSYRLTVRGDNGLSYVERVEYVPESGTWERRSSVPEISFAVGDVGIEWGIDASQYEGEGFRQIDMVMVELPGSDSGGQYFDYSDCGYFDVPSR